MQRDEDAAGIIQRAVRAFLSWRKLHRRDSSNTRSEGSSSEKTNHRIVDYPYSDASNASLGLLTMGMVQARSGSTVLKVDSDSQASEPGHGIHGMIDTPPASKDLSKTNAVATAAIMMMAAAVL